MVWTDAQLVQHAVRTERLSPEQAEDVLFLVRRLGGRRTVDEIIAARGYLRPEELTRLRTEAAAGRSDSEVAESWSDGTVVAPLTARPDAPKSSLTRPADPRLAPKPAISREGASEPMPAGRSPSLTGAPFQVVTGTKEALGGYRLEGLIATGRRATVYRATDLGTGRTVALRVFKGPSPQVSSWIQQSGHRLLAAARIAHPNVVRVLDVGRADERHFVAFEYVPGLTLEERLQSDGPLPASLALRIVGDVAHGLAAIHEHGEVHGQVCADRVFIGNDGRARLAGLGLPVDQSKSEGSGSSAAFSPAERSGRQPGQADDVLGLGRLLHGALVGRGPPQAHGRKPGTRLSGVAEDLLKDLLAPSEGARPLKANTVAERLARAVELTERQEALPAVEWKRVGSRSTVSFLAFILASVLLVAVLGEAVRSHSSGPAVVLMATALTVAAVLELIRQGQVPLMMDTAWVVRCRDGTAVAGASFMVASAFGPLCGGLDRLLGGLGVLLGGAWLFGAELQRAIAAARSDHGRGRTLAILGDLHLARWRQVVLPLSAATLSLAFVRWLGLLYFSA